MLGFEDPKRNMVFQRVHRIGKSVRGKPRPILARFLLYRDRETVLRAGFELKDTEYMILQDFPQEIIERRRKQMPKLKELKKWVTSPHFQGSAKIAAGRKLPSCPNNWFSLLILASLSLQVIKYEQIYLQPAYFTSTGGGFRLLNAITNKQRGRSFMSSRVLHVTKG